MDSAFELGFPFNIRHDAVAGLLVGGILPLGNGDGINADAVLWVFCDNVEVYGPVQRGEHAACHDGKSGIRVADFRVLQEDGIKVLAHLVGDVVGAEHVVDEVAVTTNAVLHVFVLILSRHKVDAIFLQRIALAVSQVCDADAVGDFPLPGYALRPERADRAHPGGVRPFAGVVGVDHGAAAVVVDILLVRDLAEVELSVIFNAGAEGGLCGLGAFRPFA